MTQELMMHEINGLDDEDDTCVSSKTINHYFSLFRDIVTEEVLLYKSNKIGGDNLTVEIDESCFGQRKVDIIHLN